MEKQIFGIPSLTTSFTLVSSFGLTVSVEKKGFDSAVHFYFATYLKETSQLYMYLQLYSANNDNSIVTI